MQNVFATTIKQLVSDNKFFQCFVCYQEFNSIDRFPMEICQNQHFMCQFCVKQRAFKVKGTKYRCGLCITPIKISEIKRSPFVLSVKEFIQNLVDRQTRSRQRCNNYMTSQEKIIQALMKQTKSKSQEIQKLKNELKRKENYVNEENKRQKQIEKNQQLQKGQTQKKIGFSMKSIFNKSGSMFKSNQKKKQEFKEEKLFLNKEYKQKQDQDEVFQFFEKQLRSQKKESKKITSDLQILFQQARLMKQQLVKDQNLSKSQLKQQLNQLQKHQKYLRSIAIESIQEQEQQKIGQKVEYKEKQQVRKIEKYNLKDSSSSSDSVELLQITESKYLGKPIKKVHIDLSSQIIQKDQINRLNKGAKYPQL